MKLALIALGLLATTGVVYAACVLAECVADEPTRRPFIGRCPIRLNRAPFCDVAHCAMFDA